MTTICWYTLPGYTLYSKSLSDGSDPSYIHKHWTSWPNIHVLTVQQFVISLCKQIYSDSNNRSFFISKIGQPDDLLWSQRNILPITHTCSFLSDNDPVIFVFAAGSYRWCSFCSLISLLLATPAFHKVGHNRKFDYTNAASSMCGSDEANREPSCCFSRISF